MLIPAPLRAIASPHRAMLEQVFGPIRPVAGWQPPALDVLFLCFTNRCGSNYLAHLLASTGAFNEAGEFFNAPTVLEHAVPRGLRSLAAYVSVLPDLVPHLGGRMAAKASVDQLVMLADAGILAGLGRRAHYLLLERQDRVGQAISRVIAAQNGRWSTHHAARIPDSALVFDHAAIDAELAKIGRANGAFYLFFATNGIAPVHTSYEALLANPSPVMRQLAATLSINDLQPRPDAVAIGRQANHINAAWRSAYLSRR